MTPLEAALRALAEIQPGYVFHAGKWHTDEKQALVLAKCRGLMAGYDSKWKGAPYLVGAVETLVESDLWNPETGRKSRTFRVAGQLDVTGWHATTGRRVIFDHKTTSDDIADPVSPYWKQLRVEAQPSHYALLP